MDECGAHRARHRDARRARLHALRRGDPPLRLHGRLPRHARLLHARAARRSGSTSSEDAGRHARRAEPAAGRAGLRRRLALRLEPERRQVRRHDGRRHGARGLPAERRARPRPAAPADLLPRGGGLGLRPDAARQPDHRPARHRGGAARALPCRSTTAAASGSTPTEAGYEPERWRECAPRPRRPDRLDRDAHRAGARAPGHRQPDRHRHRDRRLRARRRRRARPRRPRRRDADGPPPRPDAAAGGDDPRARAAGARRPARGRSAPSARSRSTRA